LRFSASAPGKLVVLGEYAVLDGAPALVMAVSRRCRATVAPASGSACRLRTRAAGEATLDFARGIKSGSALVDVLTSRWPTPARAFEADLDSTEFHAAGVKLGLGSSAAALVAFAGAYSAYLRADGQPEPDLTPAALIDAHRAFQGGAGSGLDVAAALTGGVIEYCLDPLGMPHIGSVRLPNSVGFAGVFAGRSASTPDFVSQYRRRITEPPVAELRQAMEEVATRGLRAAREDDGTTFLDAVSEYGRCLDALGRAMRAEIMTPDHRAIEAEAARVGVVYKVSGAGGGDVGLGFADDPDALTAFVSRVAKRGFQVVSMTVDEQGLTVEEHAQ
jgi:phosphomevalonate kinase